MQSIIQFFDFIYQFVTTGLYDFFTALFAQFIIYSSIALIKFKIYSITFAYDVAAQVMVQLDISSHINALWGSLNSNTLKVLTYFRIPEALNIVTQAYVTRFVLRFMGLV